MTDIKKVLSSRSCISQFFFPFIDIVTVNSSIREVLKKSHFFLPGIIFESFCLCIVVTLLGYHLGYIYYCKKFNFRVRELLHLNKAPC